jgi:predicted dehydrogenase/threonine dehydrogenase-like Zn-dependent dehydrogenase
MQQVLIQQGQVSVERVPAPVAEAGTILVRVDHSCISVGTEMSGIRSAAVPLWKRAMAKPRHVVKAAQLVAREGLSEARRTVRQLTSPVQPIGYSVAGLVIEVGEGVDGFRPGDRVACGGSQYAYHAEVVRVPVNLAVPVPDQVPLAEASTVTLGAIALQGVRRAAPTLGESFVVIGLGILGQLTAQLLRANGCRVIGVDLDRERIAAARALGMDAGVHPADGEDVEQVKRLTDGIGADGVIITAATPDDAVVSAAFGMCRKKGRVVLVGDVGLHLNRADFYEKELDFLISSSYGPGRYDRRYEEEGLDYPVGYVRWTENRNLGEYLRMLADGRVKVAPLISAVFPVESAPEAYAALEQPGTRPLLALLSYGSAGGTPTERRVANPAASPAGAGKLRLALVGAGNFARAVHLPLLQKLADDYHLAAIASRTGHSAATLAKEYGAGYSTTEWREVLADPQVDAVLIATRHDVHATMALEALAAGKHVMLEKPLALSADEVRSIEAFFAGDAPRPILLTGFNRRFSPHLRRVQELVAGRTGPLMVSYRMNAGYVPLDAWVHGAEGGGRNLGEACHVYDVFGYLTGARVVAVHAAAARPATRHYSSRDNFVATVSYDDGSVCTLTYTALGSREHPKERMDVYVDGKVISLDDYRTVSVVGGGAGLATRRTEKGQLEELRAFREGVRSGSWPIPLWQQIQATEVAFRVEAFLKE